MSIYSHRMGTATGSSIIIGGGFSLERTVASQGIRDKITSVANRLTSLYFYIFILLIING
jgi:nuclear pore complex protein Nup155